MEACGSDLQALRTVLYLGGGALDLCTDACGKTLTDLAAKAMRCTNEELKPFFGTESNNALKVAQNAHAKVSWWQREPYGVQVSKCTIKSHLGPTMPL